MKRKCLLFALVLALFLTGCSLPGPETTVPTQPPQTLPSETQPPTTESTQPTQILQPMPEGGDFVRVLDYIPDIVVDLRYATEDNFTGQRIYAFRELWLRYATVQKLIAVQQSLKERGLYLKVWDGFRPTSAQFTLWSVCPDPTYVSNPTISFSSHSRGNTVDATLVTADGKEIAMPTDFDDFSHLADRDYSDCPPEAAANAMLLERVMAENGFTPYSGEWWHFSDTQSFPVADNFEPIDIARYKAQCNEFISLRTGPDTSADVIAKIPVGEEFQVLAFWGDFALVEYLGLRGYVLSSYIVPAS